MVLVSALRGFSKFELLTRRNKVLATQSCPTLCDPMDCSPTGFSVHGILQARILECYTAKGTDSGRDESNDAISPFLVPDIFGVK